MMRLGNKDNNNLPFQKWEVHIRAQIKLQDDPKALKNSLYRNEDQNSRVGSDLENVKVNIKLYNRVLTKSNLVHGNVQAITKEKDEFTNHFGVRFKENNKSEYFKCLS